MKKVLILLLLLIVACSGSSEETAVEDTTTSSIEDTTTTTIPSVPTVDFNIVEIYNTKLGTDLCSDAEEIDTTSEKCLRQYRDNLEWVLAYSEDINTYINLLNGYFQSYPTEMTEEYKIFFQFVDNDYKAVQQTYDLVVNKYKDRFAGEPILNEIIFNNDSNFSTGCEIKGQVSKSENLKNLNLIYQNEIGEVVSIEVKDGNFEKKLNIIGGEFNLIQANATNYLNEEYSLEYANSFYVDHSFPRYDKIEIINPNPKLREIVSLRVWYTPGSAYEIPLPLGVSFESPNSNGFLFAEINENNGNYFGGKVNKTENYLDLEFTFVANESNQNNVIYDPLSDEWKIQLIHLNLEPYFINVFHDRQHYLDYPTKCGINNEILRPVFENLIELDS